MRVSIVGDISFQDIPIDQFKISDSVQRLLGASSLNIGNLESVISSSLPPIANHPVHLRGPYSAVKLMTSFHLLSLANNHIQDYGSEGVEATELALNQAGLFFSGLGKDINEASNPFTTEIDGEKVAVFCVSRFCRAGHGIKGTPGDSSYNLFSQIRTLCKKGYFVIVFFHWGIEYTWFVQPESQRMAKEFIEAGASVIFGGHSHRIQPIQRFSKGMAYYSMGNFLFPDFMLKSPLTIYYPEGFSMNDAYTLPVLNKYAPVSVPSLRVWPNLSRIGLIAELQICNHCIKIRQRMVRIKRQSSELDLYPRLLTRIYRAWLWLFSIIIRLPVYSWFYCKMLRLS
ncbi:MAG: CapA family protein [Gammaproteobacteria bacterium]